uniref:FYR C-terminal domain-containing protein n=1 Tax=Lactuca sativa TaxID=4236 RepID=A0A9R1WVL7_LACSA|nr:hypothetical protein LSAT_V11C800405050 [Lactuca sativa]
MLKRDRKNDPSVFSVYKMEVLRDTCTKTQPVFRVTTDDGYQFDGPDPSSCWNKIYEKIRKIHSSSYDESQGEGESMSVFKSGADMFDFSDPHVLKLIQGTSNSKMISGSLLSMPIGYSHVHVKWKDLDKCNVCHMDEVHNTFLDLEESNILRLYMSDAIIDISKAREAFEAKEAAPSVADLSSKVIKEREPYNSRVYNVIKRFQSQWPKVEDPNMKDAKDDASVSPRNRIPQHDNQTESNSKVNKYNSDEEDAISNKWKPELAWLTKALEPTLQLCRWPLPTGWTPVMELMIATGKALPILQLEHGVVVVRVYTGSFMTSLDMNMF